MTVKTKGHWPKGKARHPDAGDWQVTRMGLQAVLDQHGERGVFSLQVIADSVGVNKKTVHKWLRGENRPDETHQGMLKTWLKEARRKIDTRKQR